MMTKHLEALSHGFCTQLMGSITPFGGQNILKLALALHTFPSIAILCYVRLSCCDVLWGTMGQKQLKAVENHLFEHPKWSTICKILTGNMGGKWLKIA